MVSGITNFHDAYTGIIKINFYHYRTGSSMNFSGNQRGTNSYEIVFEGMECLTSNKSKILCLVLIRIMIQIKEF